MYPTLKAENDVFCLSRNQPFLPLFPVGNEIADLAHTVATRGFITKPEEQSVDIVGSKNAACDAFDPVPKLVLKHADPLRLPDRVL